MKRNVFVKLSAIVLSACMLLSGCGKEAASGRQNDDLVIDASEMKKAAEGSFLSEVLEAFEEKYEKISKLDYSNLNVEADVELKLGDGFGAFVDNVSGQSVSSYIDGIGLDSLMLAFDFDRNDDLYSLVVDALINDKHVIDAEGLLDLAGKYAYVALPDLFDGFVGADVADAFDIDEEFSTEVLSDMFEAQNDFTVAMSEVVSDDEFVEIFVDYYNTAVAEIGDAEKAKTELKIDDISAKAESYSYFITEEKATNLAISVLEKFVNDNELKELFVEIFDAYIDYFESIGMDVEYEIGYSSADELYDELIDEAEYALDDLNDVTDFDTENVLKVTTYYIDDEFAGFDFEVDENYLSAISVRNKNNVASELYVNVDGEEFTFKLSGNDKGGVYNGILSIYNGSEDMSIELHIEEFDLNALKKGNVDITIAIYGDCLSAVSGYDMFSDDFAIKVTEKSDYVSNASCKIFVVEGDEELASLEFDCVVNDDAEKLSVPASYVDSNDEDALNDIANVVLSGGLSTIMQNLISAGISQEIISQLMLSLL